MKILLLSAFSILAASACDAQDQANASAKATSATRDDKSAAPDAPKPGTDAPVKITSLSTCLETCEAPGMIPTNRETCKLNCEQSFGFQGKPAGAGGNADVVGTAATCFGGCYAAETGSETCVAGCKTAAGGAPSAPAAAVLDTLDTCIHTCHDNKKLRPTNEATCELNCTQVARVAGPAQPAAAP